MPNPNILCLQIVAWRNYFYFPHSLWVQVPAAWFPNDQLSMRGSLYKASVQTMMVVAMQVWLVFLALFELPPIYQCLSTTSATQLAFDGFASNLHPGTVFVVCKWCFWCCDICHRLIMWVHCLPWCCGQGVRKDAYGRSCLLSWCALAAPLQQVESLFMSHVLANCWVLSYAHTNIHTPINTDIHVYLPSSWIGPTQRHATRQ